MQSQCFCGRGAIALRLRERGQDQFSPVAIDRFVI